MQDHEPCGAEIIQLERALSKLALAAESFIAMVGYESIVLRDAIDNAKAHIE